MKKFGCSIAILALSFVQIGCGDAEEAPATPSTPAAVTPAETPAETPSEETPAETPAEETPAEAPAEETPAE